MPTYTVNVKWGKESYKKVSLDTSDPTDVFRGIVFSLTSVAPDRQKLMLKGVVLKEDWAAWKTLKDNVTIMLMGSVGELEKPPEEKTVFSEDMTEDDLAQAEDRPAGLTNLGNTCYLNATIQCLRSIKEMREALTSLKPASSMDFTDQAISITFGIKGLIGELETTNTAIEPIIFLQNLFMYLPQFSQKAETGNGYQQQDANEVWVELVRCLQQELPPEGEETGSFIDQYMKIITAQEWKCVEASQEPIEKKRESLYQLSCYIDKDVKYLQTGLQNGLKAIIDKQSPTLGRDAKYEKSDKLDRLPAYLPIQFLRFQYKGREALSAKVLKDVKFDLKLDVFDLCTPELQKKLLPMREEMKEEEDRRQEELTIAKREGKSLQTEKKMEPQPFSFDDDIGSNNSGFYELQAVLTHKGRSSSSGHYVAWVREKGDRWLMFDDDHVMFKKSEEILSLSGGGDWHSAYVLLYGPKILELEAKAPEPEPETPAAGATVSETTGEAADSASTEKMEI